MTRTPRLPILVTLLFAWLAFAPAAHAVASPTDQIRATVEQAIAVLQDASLSQEANREARRAKLKEVIYHRFDFEKMAQGAVGVKWRQFSPEQQKRFVELFSRLLEHSYLGKIESYEGEKFTFLKEIPQGPTVVRVDSTVESKGQQYKLSYNMVQTGPDEWKVFDVIIEGVGLVANYRTQFSQLLQQGSVDDLLARLDKKVKENEAAPPAKK